MRFSPEFVAEVRARTALSVLIGKTEKVLKKGGGQHKAPCRFCASRSSTLSINDAKGVYFCFKCEQAGDVFAWVMEATSAHTFPLAVEYLAQEAGMLPDAEGYQPPQPKPVVARPDPEDDARRRELSIAFAQLLWKMGAPLAGSLGEVYLSTRGIFADRLPGGVWPASLRFLPECAWTEYDEETGVVIRRAKAPAVICGVQAVDRSLTGLQRIYLNYNGLGKAGFVTRVGDRADKKMCGVTRGCALRLAAAGEHLNLGEGPETALTVLMGTQEPTWGALSLSNMGNVDFPDTIKSVTKWTDSDESDRVLAREIIRRGNERHAKLGVAVKLCPAPEGKDWNDVHREQLKTQEKQA